MKRTTITLLGLATLLLAAAPILGATANGDGPATTATTSFLSADLSTGEHLMFVLDKSGSMNTSVSLPDGQTVPNRAGEAIEEPTRWDYIRAEAAAAIRSLSAEDSFEIILFNTTHTACFGDMPAATDEVKERALDFLYGTRHGGGTGFMGPLTTAFQTAEYAEMDRLVFLSDGYPYDGGALQDYYGDAVEAQRDRVATFKVVAFQLGGESLNSMMTWLGQQPFTRVELH